MCRCHHSSGARSVPFDITDFPGNVNQIHIHMLTCFIAWVSIPFCSYSSWISQSLLGPACPSVLSTRDGSLMQTGFPSIRTAARVKMLGLGCLKELEPGLRKYHVPQIGRATRRREDSGPRNLLPSRMCWLGNLHRQWPRKAMEWKVLQQKAPIRCTSMHIWRQLSYPASRGGLGLEGSVV